jgi:peptide/nickel transport system permease protein
VVFGALVVITVNLAVDLIYPLLDPRIVAAPRLAKVA